VIFGFTAGTSHGNRNQFPIKQQPTATRRRRLARNPVDPTGQDFQKYFRVLNLGAALLCSSRVRFLAISDRVLPKAVLKPHP
jgi:hypothetical protein